MDIVDSKTRSRMMAGIKGRDTKIECMVRKELFRQGFRYRINVSSLPGKPDIVFPRYHAVIFINGCFWHGHGCDLFKWPKTRRAFWKHKIQGNRARDKRVRSKLKQLGWHSKTIWECRIRIGGTPHENATKAAIQIAKWLNRLDSPN